MKSSKIRHTVKGAAIRMVSETTAAGNQANEQTDRVTREGGDSLTTWEMGTTSGRVQTDPGICFHSACDISHTQYTCTVNMVNCKKKNAATPERVKLALHGLDAEDEILAHSKIFLCRFQGVIRITVNTIDILAPLFNDEPNVPDGTSKWSHQIGV